MTPPRLPRPQISSSSITCHGLRYALPYEVTTTPTFLKDRFLHQPLDLILGTMYRKHRGTQPIADAAAHWSAEIHAGRIELRYKKTSKEDGWAWHVAKVKPMSVMVSKGMSIRRRHHIHESVVRDVRVCVLGQTADWVAIDKPAGMATMGERNGGVNSLMTLVHEALRRNQHESDGEEARNDHHDKKHHRKLQPAHRLDKPVSGVLLIGKSPGKAAKLLQELQQATKGGGTGVDKVYIARVRRNSAANALVHATGSSNLAAISTATENATNDDNFPEHLTVEAELGWDQRHRRAVVVTPTVTAERLAHKQMSLDGMQRVYNRKKKGRERRRRYNTGHRLLLDDETAHTDNDTKNNPPPKVLIHTTQFRRLEEEAQPNDGTILVECRPITGQRHQIRAHLAAIAWPIANDAVYGGGVVEDNLVDRSSAAPATFLSPYVDDAAGTLRTQLGSPKCRRDWCTTCKWTMDMLLSPPTIPTAANNNHNDTTTIVAKGDTKIPSTTRRRLYIDRGIWLHSYRYVLPKAGIDLVAPLPDWALARSSGIGEGSVQT